MCYSSRSSARWQKRRPVACTPRCAAVLSQQAPAHQVYNRRLLIRLIHNRLQLIARCFQAIYTPPWPPRDVLLLLQTQLSMSSLHCLAPSAGASASAARQQCSRWVVQEVVNAVNMPSIAHHARIAPPPPHWLAGHAAGCTRRQALPGVAWPPRQRPHRCAPAPLPVPACLLLPRTHAAAVQAAARVGVRPGTTRDAAHNLHRHPRHPHRPSHHRTTTHHRATPATTQAESTSTRREALGAVSLALAASLASAGPAQAFLGIGEDEKVQERYTEYTVRWRVQAVGQQPASTQARTEAACTHAHTHEEHARAPHRLHPPQKEVLGKVRVVLDLPKDAPNKEDAVKELRKDINSWVAAYRREGKVAGKPSFG